MTDHATQSARTRQQIEQELADIRREHESNSARLEEQEKVTEGIRRDCKRCQDREASLTKELINSLAKDR